MPTHLVPRETALQMPALTPSALLPPARSAARAALVWGGISLLACLAAAQPTGTSAAERGPAALSAAQRGFAVLTTKPLQPPDLTAAEFERLWEIWPVELREAAAAASPDARLQLALSRYGLHLLPGRKGSVPLAAVDDGQGNWSINCLSCHGGKVAGQMIPGLGNSHYAFQTLLEDVARRRAKDGVQIDPEWLTGMLLVPLGRTNGTTNAQTFSVLLTALRDHDLNLVSDRRPPRLVHYDLDAPPFWNVKKKKRLYIDGYVAKSHRVIMQFALTPGNDAQTIRGWEDDFRDVLAWIESVEAPRYPWSIDSALAETGRRVFLQSCAECHGRYDPDGDDYPERRVPIDEIGTDPRRLEGMPDEHRRFIRDSWLGEYGRVEVVESPGGYVAPPLDGIWASAPYFHNGSVPTLWHVLHSAERPVVWLRSHDGYDQRRVGLEVSEFERLPEGASRADVRRQYYDTTRPGASAAGHTFPDQLDEPEKEALLEYLKTL